MLSLLTFVILALCSGVGRSTSVLSRIKPDAKCRRFDSSLDSQQEVPSLDPKTFTGKCRGFISLNDDKDKLVYKIRCRKGLSRRPLAAHIHMGAVGENGSVIVPLEITGAKNRKVAKGTIEAAVVGQEKFEEIVEFLYSGGTYINIHTPKAPSGEVRGQITPPPEDCLRKKGKSIDFCSLPLETGRCKGYFVRWGYDDAEGKCVEFTYGGCGANANNFHTEGDCRRSCPGV